MLSNRTLTEEQTLIRRHFTDFFESERYEEKYHGRIQDMMLADRARLLMDMGDLLDFVPATALGGGGDGSDALGGATSGTGPNSLGAGIIYEPSKYVPLLELALHDVVLRQQPEYLKVDYRSRAVHVGFEGPVGTVCSPRELYARHLNTMVALEGIVTRQSSNRPRVLETVHYCPETNKFTKKEFRDQLTPMIDSSHLPTVNVMPKTDMEGHALRTELGLSTFVDSQCAVLQEAPERTPTGQLPRNIDLRFDDDLVDSVKPGDRVVLVGVYMPYTTADSKSFQSIVLVNHVVSTQAYTLLTRHVPAVEEKLVSFARKTQQLDGPSGVLRALGRAVAPTIYGMVNEKRAILLMMVGGVERQAHTTHIRGDINILLVGEPSTAKSQLLRFVLGVAPLVLSTTGKGSSGVGLTAAVTADPYTGERSLSAGAMVLADRGILCIDEFDKMSTTDRTAMHEAMEQQTVTIAKAGIHASLNARCSVLAAANPIYGFYSVQHRLSYNVGLPESLLSRFDLTFIILDQHSSEHNRRIANHILRNHMTAQPVGSDPVVTRTVVDSVESTWQRTTSSTAGGAFQGENNGVAGGAGGGGGESAGGFDFRMTTNSSGESIVSVDFLRAYVQLAKRGSPLLTEASQRLVCECYDNLRDEQRQGSRDGFYITARTLEAIIRLSTAHAKLRLSPTVEEADVNAAAEMLRASVYAPSAATQQRVEDNRYTADERAANSELHRARGVDVLTRSREGHESCDGGAHTPAAQRTRTEGEQGAVAQRTSPPTEPAAASTTDALPQVSDAEAAATAAAAQRLSRLVVDALKGFQREQRSTVPLRELHDRISAAGGASVASLEELTHTVSQLQGDAFVFESVAEGGDDTIQLI